MDAIAGLPFFPVHFDATGAILHQSEVEVLLAHIQNAKLTRLAVVSHGWRNDEDYALALYKELFGNVGARLNALGVTENDRPTVLGVFWPAMALPEFDKVPPAGQDADGVAASMGGPQLDTTVVAKQIDALIETFGHDDGLNEAKTLLSALEDSETSRKKFVELLRQSAQLPTDVGEDNSDRFLNDDPSAIFESLVPPIKLPPAPQGDGAALGLGDVVSKARDTLLNASTGALGSACRLVNYLTFYQMKERAGVIGQGLNSVLAEVRKQNPTLPINLVGHSFGARVVTSAVARAANLNPCSLSLLQGAFSHNGFASSTVWEKDGYFRPTFSEQRVCGPIIATHTANDMAVGVDYPIACRLAGQNATALGDQNDPYGGLGRNGAIHLKASEKGSETMLREATGVYAFDKAKANNLLADRYIHDHGDVKNLEVANAVAQVILSL